ncbi:hypothetical protein DL96DRAFT_1598096 [Flagelloscypha sp. PMI_526]|nr:hypothetical protein DL96DRAFT_1598096 [Flagelloscypha sp. PMI_526]
MASTLTNPIDIPPFGLESILNGDGILDGGVITCAQALGWFTEIYIGTSDSRLLRFALQAEGNQLESYAALTELKVTGNGKPVDELVVIPSIMRALVLCDSTLHFYLLPSLEPVPYTQIRPIRNTISFCVDNRHLRRPPPPPPSLLGGSPLAVPPVELCLIKKAPVTSKLTIGLYALREKLVSQRDIPCPEGVTRATRIGRTLCAADAENYLIIDLQSLSSLPFIPVCQDYDQKDKFAGKPRIIPINDEEFLVASLMAGGNTLGVFVNTRGDPVRGTLEWPAFPESLSLDYPYIIALLPNQTVEIHNLEQDQAIAQVIPAPSNAGEQRHALASAFHGFLVPSHEKSSKMALRKVPLVRV